MLRSILFVRRIAGPVGALAVAMTVSACNLETQEMPAISGPSEFGLSVTLTATPDTITQDGTSQATISARVRDAAGQPVPGVMLQFPATSSTPLVRELSFTEVNVKTDDNGQATTGLIAPPAPATIPSEPPMITVRATPLSDNFQNAVPRTVAVRLLAPAGTPLGNWDPVAHIMADPRVASYGQTIHFNASLTTDEGQACGSRCTYIWEFGDGGDAVRGITANHRYDSPGSYTVTLTVTDDRGGVDQETVSITIIEPTAN